MEYPDMEQIEHLVKVIAPQYPLKHEEVRHIISTYLQECLLLGVRYNGDEIDKRIWKYYKECY